MRSLRRLIALLPPRWRWARKVRGGHWELVDFDQLFGIPGQGTGWLHWRGCSGGWLLHHSRAVLRCEDYSSAP